MKFSSKLYQSLLYIYRLLPYQSTWARLLRALPIDLDRFYRDLHFKGVFSVKTSNGSFRLHHLGTTIENELFWKGLNGSLENDTLWFWEHAAQNAEVIIDIGANTGVYALIAKAENLKAKIIAFEPSIKIYPVLKQNVELNGWDVICEKIAISNSNDQQVFYDLSTLEYPTSGSLSSKKLKELIEGRTDITEYQVTCMTLDDYLMKNNLPRVDLIKIDVELHEPAVFEGFKRLQQIRPTIITEVLTQDVANSIAACADLDGYLIYRLIAPYKVQLLNTLEAHSQYRNVLLLPKERNLPENTAVLPAS